MGLKFYNLLLHKAYFDKGMGLTNYVKYVIAFFGVASSDVKSTLWIAFFYGIICYFLGMFWYKKDLVKTENEVANRNNLFVKEMRDLSGSSVYRKT